MGGLTSAACDRCLRRTALFALVAPHVERARHERGLRGGLLALGDEELLAAVGGRRAPELAAELERFEPEGGRAAARSARLHVICRHDDRYPRRLLSADDAPAALFVMGETALLAALDDEAPAVAVVGARRATPYGLETARALGRGLAAAGVPVVSGLALGIDAAAHTGALEVRGPTLAVLAGGADVPYPASKASLYRQIVANGGAIVSEMPPGFRPFRWSFPARNRIIAGLADATIVVEAAERSGSLITAELADDIGRIVAAVPGPVSSPMSAGANALLRDGAEVVRDAQDVLDTLLGPGVATARGGPDPAALEPRLRALLDRLATVPAGPAALIAPGGDVDATLAALTELELLGFARRAPGGVYVRADLR